MKLLTGGIQKALVLSLEKIKFINDSLNVEDKLFTEFDLLMSFNKTENNIFSTNVIVGNKHCLISKNVIVNQN